MLDPRLAIAGGLGALLIGAAGAWQVQDWRYGSKIAAIRAEQQAAKDAADAIAAEEATGFEGRRAQIETRNHADRETVKVIYRDRQVPADCALPVDAASLLDQARIRANAATGEPVQPMPTASPID